MTAKFRLQFTFILGNQTEMGKRKAKDNGGDPAEETLGGTRKMKDKTTQKSNSSGLQESTTVKMDLQKVKPAITPPSNKKVKSPPLSQKRKEDETKNHPTSTRSPKASPKKHKDPHHSSSIPSPIQSPQDKTFLNDLDEDQSTNQVEIFVHRFRTPNCIPKAILRLCATPYMPGLLSYVAISREGGAIELMSVDEHSKCVGIVEGSKDRHVDALVWICSSDSSTGSNPTQMMTDQSTGFLTSRRLFGASRDGLIFEIDFYTKSLCNVVGSGGGSVFCLTSLCPCCSSQQSTRGGVCKRLIAAGCEDGSIRIYKAGVKEDNALGNSSTLNLVKILPSTGAAVLSLAWLMNSSGVGGIFGSSTLYAGLADGTIRKFESSSYAKSTQSIGSGIVLSSHDVDHNQDERDTSEYSISVQWTSTLRITVENRGRAIPTKIWALKVLDDHTIVSGDSLGHVQFWDGKLGTLIQTFDHSKTDVLDLAISHDQTKVMACGIEPTIICISKDTASTVPGVVRKRVITSVIRRHSHDVHSLVTVYQTDPTGCAGMLANNGDGKSMKMRELLYSGGADTKICSYFVGDFRKYRPRIVYKYPPMQNISLAHIPRIFTIMRPDRIDFYKLADRSMKPKKITDSKILHDMNSSIGSVFISSNHNLSCCDISDDGKILAVGNAVGLALFSIEYPLEGGLISKVHKPCHATNFSCSTIKFIPGIYRRIACCTSQGDIRILRIDVVTDGSDNTQLDAHQEFSLVERKEICSHLAPSADGRWLAAASYGTVSGIVEIYSMADGCKFWWTLPLAETPISCIKFLGGKKSCPVLFVGCNNYAFYIYDVERRSLSDFSQDLGFPVGPSLPIELNRRMECPYFVTQNPSKVNQFLMVSVILS